MVSTSGWLGVAVIATGVAAGFVHHLRYFAAHEMALIDLGLSFVGPSLALWTAVATVVYVRRSDVPDAALLRLAGWFVLGAGVLGAAGYLALQVVELSTIPASTVRLSVTNWTTGGGFIGLLLGFYDVRQSQAIRRARAREEDASRQTRRLSVLNRVLRHDIRNKLTVIRGHVERLEADGGNDSTRAIGTAADDLLDIAERVRTLYAVTDEQARQRVDLAACITEAVADVRGRYPGVELSTALADDLDAYTYPVIRDTIDDVIENAVVHNEAVPDLEVDVRLRRTRARDTEYSEIVVEDNGNGLPPEERVVLGEAGETPLHHSLGTGLWLTRWLVEESNGDFEISNRPSGGTRVAIRLPAVA